MDEKPSYEALKKRVRELEQAEFDFKRVEGALRASELKYRALVEHIPAVIYTAAIDAESSTLYISPQIFKMIGFKPDEWKEGHDVWFKQIHPDDRERVISEIGFSHKNEIPFSSEYRMKKRDGHTIWIRDQATFIKDNKGNPLFIQGLMLDITEHKKTEEALRESENRFRTVADKSPNMIFINKKGRVIYVNDYCKVMMGYREEDFYSSEFTFLSLMTPESMKQAEFSLKKHMEGLEVPPLEYTLIKKDGKLINTLISTKLIDYKEEKAILGIVTDITDQKRIERQIAASLNEKEVLLREIHHRVKNNMQIIISLMGMHSSRTKDTQVRQTLDECKDRIMAMSLVHEALYKTEDLARIDFEIYLKKLCSNLNQSHGASGKGIVITVEKCNVTLNMDQSIAVGIVSSELIANALKHAFPLGKGGRVSISLLSHNVEEVKLIIKDDGIGLPRKINILTASSLGLLLAVATVTRQLGGSIKVERNGGTRFIILFKKNAL